jgi:atypical dual specificity phosphatase
MSFIVYHNFQVDAESNKELEQWNEMLKNDAIKLCQENNFNTGFFEGSDNNSVVDAYELKVIFIFSRFKFEIN